jgi:hypothetical protein
MKPRPPDPALSTEAARLALWLWFAARPGFVPVSQFFAQFKGYAADRRYKGDLLWLVNNGHLAKRVDHAKRSPSGRFPDIEYCALEPGPGAVRTARTDCTAPSSP